jgi:hypothetical protein
MTENVRVRSPNQMAGASSAVSGSELLHLTRNKLGCPHFRRHSRAEAQRRTNIFVRSRSIRVAVSC